MTPLSDAIQGTILQSPVMQTSANEWPDAVTRLKCMESCFIGVAHADINFASALVRHESNGIDVGA